MFKIGATQREGYVELVCRGPANLANFRNLIDRVRGGEFGDENTRKYLIDLRPISGTIATLERFELGGYIGKSVPHLKIAAISKKETHSKLGENVAVNRGANILATDDENEAKAWLVAEK